MNTRYNNLIIDTHNLFHRMSYHNLKNNTKEDLAYKQTVKSCLSKITYFKDNFLEEDGVVWCLFDNHDSKDNIRCELSDDYKYNRKEQSDLFYRYIEILKSLLLSYSSSLNIVYVEKVEADDVVKPIIDKLIDKDDSILLISSDFDWSRLINYQDRSIEWFNHTDPVYNKSIFKDKFSFIPSLNKITLYKSIKGDTSDNIKVGLPKLEDAELFYILEKYQDVFDLITLGISDPNLSKDTRRRLVENSTKLRINWNLVNFIPLDNINIKNHIYAGRFKRNTLRKYYEMLSIDLTYDERYHDEVSNTSSSFFITPQIKRK